MRVCSSCRDWRRALEPRERDPEEDGLTKKRHVAAGCQAGRVGYPTTRKTRLYTHFISAFDPAGLDRPDYIKDLTAPELFECAPAGITKFRPRSLRWFVMGTPNIKSQLTR